VLAAMAAGVPVVATAVGGVPALIADAAQGVLVPHRRPDLLAEAALALLADPSRRRATRRSTREQGIERLS